MARGNQFLTCSIPVYTRTVLLVAPRAEARTRTPLQISASAIRSDLALGVSTATQYNKMGLISLPPISANFTVANPPAVLPISVSGGKPPVNGTALPGAVVKVYAYSDIWGTGMRCYEESRMCWSRGVPLFRANRTAEAGTGAFSVQLDALPVGRHRVMVSQRDARGESDAGGPYEFTVPA
jgi:hypothetical protein